MSTEWEQFKENLSSLTASERAELAHYLLRSLDTEEEGTKSEWLALAERRMADVRAGQVVGIPAEQVLRDLLEPEQ